MPQKQPRCDLLKKIAQEQEYEDYVVKEKDTDGASIMSSLFYVSLRSKKKRDLKLFAKTGAWSEQVRLNTPILCPYTVELYFYTTLWKQYERLEEICNVPEEHRFRKPTLYGCCDEYLNDILVIEDLVAEGYQDFDRYKSANLEYMSAGIALIAQFHALSLAYSHYDPEGFNRTSEYLTTNKYSELKQFIKDVTPKMLANALSSAENHREKLKEYCKNTNIFYNQLLSYYVKGKDNVIIHGDFKPNNLMHRRVNGRLELAVMDFQMIHNADAVLDLMYFIFTATDESFRRSHYHDLLELYYEKLRASLLRLRIDVEEVYPEKTYRNRLEENAMSGLVVAIAYLPMVLVDKDKIPAFNGDADLTELAVESNALCRERFNGILNNYVEWGLL